MLLDDRPALASPVSRAPSPRLEPFEGLPPPLQGKLVSWSDESDDLAATREAKQRVEGFVDEAPAVKPIPEPTKPFSRAVVTVPTNRAFKVGDRVKLDFAGRECDGAVIEDDGEDEVTGTPYYVRPDAYDAPVWRTAHQLTRID
jgi:hypothetical protein